MRKLDLSGLPAPETGAASFASRGLDADEVRDALPALLRSGLVERKDGDGLALTPSGAAALYAVVPPPRGPA